MKQLTLIRHAKSSWDDPALADDQRPLSARGRRDAPEMGRRLSVLGFLPDMIVSSPAKRARRTAKAIRQEIGGKVAFAIEPSVYMAAPGELIDLARSLGDSLGHVAIVGHNPGLTDLANLLGDLRIENVPTAGVVRLELDVDTWKDVRPGCGRTIDFDYPKRVR